MGQLIQKVSSLVTNPGFSVGWAGEGGLPVMIQCVSSNVTAININLTTTSKIVVKTMAAKTRHQPQAKIPHAPATRKKKSSKM